MGNSVQRGLGSVAARSEEPARGRTERPLLHAVALLQWVLLAALLACAATNVVRAIRAIPSASDTTYPESAVIATAHWAWRSHRIYPSLVRPPYTPAPYGPLFYLGLAAVGNALHGDNHAIRIALRSLVFASYLLAGLAVFALARDAGAAVWAALAGGVTALAAPFVLFWNASARPDFPALLLTLLGIRTITHSRRPGWRTGVAAGILCAMGFLSKQSMVAAPLAIAGYLALRRWYRPLGGFVLAAAAAAGGVVAYLLLRGEPVLRDMLLMRHAPAAVQPAVAMVSDALGGGLGLLVVAGGAAGMAMALRGKNSRLLLVGMYAALAALVTVLTLPQVGSNVNYLLEPWMGASVLMACALGPAAATWRGIGQPLQLGALMVLIVLVGHGWEAIRRAPGPPAYRYQRLAGLRILSTDPTFTVRGKEPELLDPYLADLLENRAGWSAAGVAAEIKQQRFDVIFLTENGGRISTWHGAPRLSPELAQQVQRFYRPLCRTARVLVMTPKGRPDGFSAADASYTLGTRCRAQEIGAAGQ